MVANMTNTITLPSGKTPFQQRTDNEVKGLLIQSARNYLEQEYHNFIQETVNANLREAQRGAIPGTEQVTSTNCIPPVYAPLINNEKGIASTNKCFELLFCERKITFMYLFFYH